MAARPGDRDSGGLCAGVAGGQSRHGGGGGGQSYHSAPSYHQAAPAYRQPAPAYRQQAPAYRQPAPGYGQAEPAYRGAPEGYRPYGAQQQYRPQGQQGMQPERYAQQQSPAPVERRAPPQQGQPDQVHSNQGQSSQLSQIERRNSQTPGAPRGEHLADWMNQHRNLTPQQQQQALEHEPGFNQLPQQTQQRMRNRLAQLNAMPPAAAGEDPDLQRADGAPFRWVNGQRCGTRCRSLGRFRRTSGRQVAQSVPANCGICRRAAGGAR